MFLSLTSTASSACDLEVLLDHSPGRVWSVDIGIGMAHVFYPRCDQSRCTARLLVEVDPTRRTTQLGGQRSPGPSSVLTVAIGRLFGPALAGRCNARPELVDTVLPLEIELPVIPAGGDNGDLAERLFEPLGYRVEYRTVPADGTMSDWDETRSVSLSLTGDQTVADALSHLSVLAPVLDDDRPPLLASDEIAPLLLQAGRWLAAHPERKLITHHDVASRAVPTPDAFGRPPVADRGAGSRLDAGPADAAPEPTLSLNDRRLAAVTRVLLDAGARSVIDLGCGEGQLIGRLLAEPSFERIVGVDVSDVALQRAEQRLGSERMPEPRRGRVSLMQSALTSSYERLVGFDAAAVVEVIEHIDLDQLGAFEQVVFGYLGPATVVVTTPNREYNVHLEHLQRGLRHSDHRFEWTREEFARWFDGVARRHGYQVTRAGIGRDRPGTGPPTQMAVFRR